MLIYNNFPWPHLSNSQKSNIEKISQDILNIRLKYPNSTLSDLYDPIAMPSDLVRAHDNLNRAVESAYGRLSFEGDAERLSFLLEKYEEQNTNNRSRIKHKVSDLRLTLASMIVKDLASSKSFGKTKFAKVFYIADMLCEQDLG
ncbi:TPA: hypothetical protein JBJ29_15255, partial [Legionella pneumophila]|nr:hypothetical protein [Legionella pneumophila]